MSVPCDPLQGLVVVPAEIAGPAGRAVVRRALDTGASGSVVNVAILVVIERVHRGCADDVPPEVQAEARRVD